MFIFKPIEKRLLLLWMYWGRILRKCYAWLDAIDPYAIQRTALHKGAVIAAVMVAGYWFFRPTQYLAYVVPNFILFAYEQPGLAFFARKQKTILFVFTAMLCCGISFYLLMPFRLLFLLYSMVFFSVLYFLALNWIPYARYSPLMTISTSAFFITIIPLGDKQMAYDIFCSSILSMVILWICLRYLHDYFRIWRLAQEKFIKTLEKDISFTVNDDNVSLFSDEIAHINMVYSYRGLVQKPWIFDVYRISYNLRNIQFALSNVTSHDKNKVFWHHVKWHLQGLRHCMGKEKPYQEPLASISVETALETYTLSYLTKTICYWNRLCATR